MRCQSYNRSCNNDQPVAFAKKHRFKDTLALFIVFLSFNHFASLCLLISFVIATRFRNFLANSFITIFLSKKPSPAMNEVTHIEPGCNETINKSFAKKVETPANAHKFGRFSSPILFFEMIVATILKLYGEDYFVSPIENLALSILASSMINDPSDCLSYATSCSVLYAVTLNACQQLRSFHKINDFMINYDFQAHFSIPLTAAKKFSFVKGFNFTKSLIIFAWVEKYIQHLLYYISFHIVIYQFTQSIFNPSYSHDDKLKPNKKAASLKNDTNRNPTHRIVSSSSIKSPAYASNSNQAQQNSNPPLIEKSTQNYQDNWSSFQISNATANPNLNVNSNMPNFPPQLNWRRPNENHGTVPYFTSIVKEFESFEPSVISAAGSNSQTVTTNVTIPLPTSPVETGNLPDSSYTNQLYEIKIDFEDNIRARNLKLDVTATSNLENFIRHLFRRKNQHLIPPLWSIVVTLKTTNFEKRYLKNENKDNVLGGTLSTSGSGSSSTLENETSDSSISPTNSNGSQNNAHNDKTAESVFNKLQATGTMALIANTAFDDYAQLHLVSTRDNIFKKDDKDYKVCIVEIGSNSITFHIENLHEGELIVLVNGVIWSEVSCALILDCEGEELVVVGGLVPSCSYDIQFINRLSQTEDYLISDLMVRTLGSHKEITEKFESIDFSFPSYYHRKFLSPLLTLKHSVLTTNTNLAEGRTKLKKSKKEISKKLSTLRQDIDHFKAKISQNASNDEKNASKVDSLKLAVQQSESAIAKLEQELKKLTDKEVNLEEIYLKQKDMHLKKTMEFSKAKESLDNSVNTTRMKVSRLQQELSQFNSKKEKLVLRQEKLQKEVDHNTEEIENFKNQLTSRRERERSRRQDLRARELNEFELNIKGLEQDISRLEGENASMHKLIHGF